MKEQAHVQHGNTQSGQTLPAVPEQTVCKILLLGMDRSVCSRRRGRSPHPRSGGCVGTRGAVGHQRQSRTSSWKESTVPGGLPSPLTWSPAMWFPSLPQGLPTPGGSGAGPPHGCSRPGLRKLCHLCMETKQDSGSCSRQLGVHEWKELEGVGSCPPPTCIFLWAAAAPSSLV